MKDALGHGSAGTGAHTQGTQATPQVQRRHFEAIAADLKARSASPDEVHAMADKLATTNPGFRRDFFVAAATGGDYRFKSDHGDPAVQRRAAKVSGADLNPGLGNDKSFRYKTLRPSERSEGPNGRIKG